MKTIIAGGRDITDMQKLLDAIKISNMNITEIVCGMAKGVDDLGRQYAELNNIPIKCFPANWNKYGNRAGPIRNEEMGNYADALIAVWDGESKGTKHMIDYATKKKLDVYVHRSYEQSIGIETFFN